MAKQLRIITGEKFNGYIPLWYSKNVFINGGKFGNETLGHSRNATINGGKFWDNTLWHSKNAVINGGEFGSYALCYSKNTYALNITGNFKGIQAPKSGLIVAKNIESIHEQDYKPNSKIFALNCPQSRLVTKINSEQLEKIEKIVANNKDFRKGLVQAIKSLGLWK